MSTARRRNSGGFSASATTPITTAAAARRRSSSEAGAGAGAGGRTTPPVPKVSVPVYSAGRTSNRMAPVIDVFVQGGDRLGVLREDEELHHGSRNRGNYSSFTYESSGRQQRQQQQQQQQQPPQDGVVTRSRDRFVHTDDAMSTSTTSTNDLSPPASSSPSSSMTPRQSGSSSHREDIDGSSGSYLLLGDKKRDEQRKQLEKDLRDFTAHSNSPAKCPKCSKSVYAREACSFGNGILYHKLCSTCDGKHGKCHTLLVPATGTAHGGKIFCQYCLQREEGVVGYGPAYHATRRESLY